MNKVLIYVHFLAFLVNLLIQATAKNIDTASSRDSLRLAKPTSEKSEMPPSLTLCYNSTTYKCKYISCRSKEPLLLFQYCATFSDETKLLSVVRCLYYFQPNSGHNVTIGERLPLPRNLSQLNDYMCGPMNRKGLVCSECADGFGPSVTSFGYRCVNCTDAWYQVPLFLLLDFAPVTVLYLIILVLQISITSAPLPCFIMYAQLIIMTFDSSNFFLVTNMMFTDDRKFRLDMQIMLTMYGMFNLDFGHYNILPPYCLSSKLKPIHIVLFGYISAFYPVMLIFLTWACVRLHGQNFRPLVWLWRPFHRCFVRLRRGWDTRSDIIDVFTTFFLLSYSKIVHQTMLLTSSRAIANIDQAGRDKYTYRLIVDPTIEYGGLYHLAFAVPSLFICLVFNFLPSLLLILYPIKAFRSCLIKLHLKFIAVQVFIDKVHSCYRNSLNEGRDMRSFSSFYFCLRLVVCLPSLLLHILNSQVYINEWFVLGILFCIISLFVAFAKPYIKPYMNHLDAILHLHFAILCFVLSTGTQKLKTPYITATLSRVLLSVPMAVFLFGIVLKIIIRVCRRNLFKFPCAGTSFDDEPSSQRALAGNAAPAAQPLIQPTSTVIRYGADNNGIQ